MTASPELLDALVASARLADRLREALARLQPCLPFDGARVLAAETSDPLLTDAFLKRFENLACHLQDQLWPRIAVEQGMRNPAIVSRRDHADLKEKYALPGSADAFLDVIRLRNRLSHIYPTNPGCQARRLNEVAGLCPIRAKIASSRGR